MVQKLSRRKHQKVTHLENELRSLELLKSQNENTLIKTISKIASIKHEIGLLKND